MLSALIGVGWFLWLTCIINQPNGNALMDGNILDAPLVSYVICNDFFHIARHAHTCI